MSARYVSRSDHVSGTRQESTHFTQARFDVSVVDVGIPFTHQQIAGQHSERRRFAGAIDPQESEALSIVNSAEKRGFISERRCLFKARYLKELEKTATHLKVTLSTARKEP